MSPQHPFVRAKVEHYLDRVEEYYWMARYVEARKITETVHGIDPENRECRALERAIGQAIDDIVHRSNGKAPKVIEGVRQAKLRKDLVLIVDQDERVLSALAHTLRLHLFRVIGASSYDAALDILSLTRPEIVLSEVNFHDGARGYDLFTWMRNLERFRDVPFIFSAVRLDPDVLIAGKRLGVEDFLQKPFNPEVVAVSIERSLMRRLQPSAAA